MTRGWGGLGYGFTSFTLVTEAALLFAGAQTGFIDGPRVMGYMAADHWLPTRFNHLSHRLVISNGVLVIGVLAIVIMLLTRGLVGRLVVLFSINVFITFVLSQLGMVVHWIKSRSSGNPWKWRLFVNGLGFSLSCLILVTMVVVKFTEGGWITLVCTGCLAVLAYLTRHHYDRVGAMLDSLNWLVAMEETGRSQILPLTGEDAEKTLGREVETAGVLVTGFNGYGLYTLANINRTFRDIFRNYVFIEIGVVEAHAFKDEEVVKHAAEKVEADLQRYTDLMKQHGYRSSAASTVGTNLVESIIEQIELVGRRYPNTIFFAGQLVFPRDTPLMRLLHNDIVFTVQRRLYQKGIPFFIVPVRVMGKGETGASGGPMNSPGGSSGQ